MSTSLPVLPTAVSQAAATGAPTSDPVPANGQTVFWLRKPGARKRQTVLVQGAKIEPTWLDHRLRVTQVRFQGALAQALTDLQQASKAAHEKYLPIVRLRATLMANLDGVLRLDRDLGLREGGKPALEIRQEAIQDSGVDVEQADALRDTVLKALKRWHLDVLLAWAERNELGEIASRIGPAIHADGISIVHVGLPLAESIASGGQKREFDLIARQIAERLVGEELFDGLGPCEIVADPTSRNGTAELMTAPNKVAGNDNVFSMAAHLSVFTLPYSKELYLRVSAIKRVWASKVPGRKPNAPPTVRCYIVAPNKPIMLARVRCPAKEWEFDDDYLQYLSESNGKLPSDLKDAVARTMPDDSGWWFGLPKLTTLFDRIGGRTVFEGDEFDLHTRVMSLLPDVVSTDIPYREVKLDRKSPTSEVAMLKLDDFGLAPENVNTGLAGAALLDPSEDDAGSVDEVGESLTVDQKRTLRIAKHRAANVLALGNVHANQTPVLWVFGASTREKTLIAACIAELFGDAVKVSFEILPDGVHGLKENLDSPKGKGVERFDARLKRWEPTAKQIPRDGGPRHVLICAPKEINGRTEDPVNYYAGLHAMCSMADANVHHILPTEIDRKTQKPDEQNFVHRLQSALLDVFMAHSGVVLGTAAFVASRMPMPLPQAVYGIQVVRSRAKNFTSESSVSFLLFTRLMIGSGTTEVRFAYRTGHRSLHKGWMPLNEGLRWLGAQRQITSDEKWVKENFAGQVKAVLNEMASADPRAVVLVDWSTVGGLWPGINDASLIAGQTGRVMLDNTNLALACPQMTFVRLRANRDATMSLRKRSTMLYEAWKNESEQATGDLVEEAYTTTLKTIVELNATGAATGLSNGVSMPRHYLMVMGYRKTVQILRGMSCYRTMRRMKALDTDDKDDKEGKRFDWEAVSPSKDDAALPASLEVTVLACPDDVVPDEIARLVMGLRLGYAHYDEWTATPAPLFFAAKVQDYIIRYPDTTSEGPAPDDSDTPPDDPDDKNTRLIDTYLGDVEKAVLGEVAASPEAESDSIPDTVPMTKVSSEGGSAVTLTSPNESVTTHDAIDVAMTKPKDPMLLRAWESASAVTRLSANKFGTVPRKLYEDMLCSNVRIVVDLPWFVTRKTVITEGAWPDSRAIKRFWQTQVDLGYRRSKGTAPSSGELPNWLMSRLRIPQAAHTIDHFGLLPEGARTFEKSTAAFTNFLLEYESGGEKFPAVRDATPADHEAYVRWLMKEEGDEGIAWTLCQLAHFPFKLESHVLLQLLDGSPLGPRTLAALQYFTDCNEVVTEALKLRKQGVKKIPELVRRAMPAPAAAASSDSASVASDANEAVGLGSNSTPSQEESPAAAPVSLSSFAVSVPASGAATLLMPAGTPEPPMSRHPLFQAISDFGKDREKNPMGQADSQSAKRAAQVPATELARLAALLVPGAEDFKEIQEALFVELDRLDDEHSTIQQKLREAQQLQLFREQITERLTRILQRTNVALSKITTDLMSEQTGKFSVHEPDNLEFLLEDERLTALEATIDGVENAVEEALQAHARFEDVDAAHEPELQGLSSLEKARCKRKLLDAALKAFDLAQHRLNERLLACPILRSVGSLTESSAPFGSPAGADQTTVNNDAAETQPEPSDAPVGIQAAVDPDPGVDAGHAALLATEDAPIEATTGQEDSVQADAAVSPARSAETLAPAGDKPTDASTPVIEEALTAVEDRSHSPAEDEILPAGVDLDVDSVNVHGAVADGDHAIEVPDTRGMLATLNRSIHARHWGLSQACIQAIRAVTPAQIFDFHTLAWSSMLSVLAGLSARTSVELRLPSELQRFLDAGGTSDSSLMTEDAPCSTLASTIGLLGAGIVPMLFEGHEGAARWSVLVQARSRLIDHPPLLALVDRLSSLNSTSLMLSRETMSAVRVGIRESLNAEIMRQRERAGHWQSDASIYTHWTASDYVEMHRAMFDDKHGLVLGKCLSHISRGSDDAARKLLPEVRKYVDKMAGTLGDLRKRTGRRRAFEGPAREYLASNLEISVKFIEDFFDLLDRGQNVTSTDLPRNLVDFLVNLYKDLNEAMAYVRDLPFAHPIEIVHRELMVKVLSSVLNMMDDQAQPAGLTDEEQLLLLQLPLNADFRPTLSVHLEAENEGTALLTDPFSVFAEVDAIEDDLVEKQAVPGSKALVDLLERAAQRHRDSGRLFPARAIELRLPRQVVAAAHSANEAAQRKQRGQLSEDLNDARQRTMNAMSMGALAEAEASRMLKAIEALSRANVAQEIGSVTAVSTGYTDYPHARVVLRHHVLEPLSGRIKESRERLEEAISQFSADAESANPDPQAHARVLEKIKRIRQMLEDGSPSGIRVAHNAFALLKDDRLPLLRLEEFNTTRMYEEFQASLKATSAGHRPLDRLVEILRSAARPSDPEWVSRLESDQRQDAADFIGHWIALCASRHTADLHEPLTEFFSALGTAESPVPIHGVAHAGRLAFYLPIKTFVGADRSGQGMFIPPTLGSAANHIQGFVLKHHASTEAFGQIITESAQSTPTFVLARTSLSMAKRSSISRDHPVLLVDDDLVAYLAVHPGERVSKLMEVGLLTFNNNPYDDYGGRPVPPEMFFGRKAELRLLRGVKSAAVLYGGRRLGKSSLLDQIQNDSRQQMLMNGAHGQGEMAIYIPLETRLDTASFGENHRLFAWRTIYNALVKVKFIGAAKGDLATPEAIRDWISSEIVDGRASTNACYLLIDEADEVMREDLNGEALFITNLQTLCDQVRSHCQMRYVIAGLHNLTRMTTVGNSVLGKAETIALQPFSTDVDILNGIELITRPLAALGFYFPKGAENLPLRIMALCNFYPAFIQLYCKNLVTRLYNKRASLPPPTIIDSSDLDAVERDDEFLREIQKKFELNLDLDKRYKAIALILADVYYANAGHGASLGLTTSEIRDHCQTFTPEHFLNTSGAAYEALLEEMEKLTVLERSGNRFQLRTPHIATMLGTRERVSRLIEELAGDKPTESRIPGESRLIIRQDRDEKVFPMPSAWVRSMLRGSDGDLVVLVGNQLSGLYNIEKLPKEWDLGQDAVYEVKLFSSPDNARIHLQRARRLTDNAPTRRLVALPPRSWRTAEVESYAALAGSLSNKPTAADPNQRQRLASIRLALIASPDLAWELAQRIYPAGTQVAQVTKGWRIEPVPVWSDDAVFFRLDQKQNTTVRDSTPAREALIDATCGFGSELDRLCTAGASIESALKAAEEERNSLASNRATFYAKVGMPQAFSEEDLRETEQLLALIDGECRADDGVEETIRTSKVTKAQFEYFQWMGLLQVRSNGRWKVPTPYKRLIG